MGAALVRHALDAGDVAGARDLADRFLARYPEYWFNALRISNWGSEKEDFRRLKDYSLSEIKYALAKLEAEQRVDAKDGKKSRVYKVR